MTGVVPPRFLFRWSFPVRQWTKGPAASGRLLNLGEEYRLPSLEGFDGVPDAADVRMAWNGQGLALSVKVAGKKQPLRVSHSSPSESDGVQVWFDTRATQTVHRATRFCSYFCLLPDEKKIPARAYGMPIARAREDAEPADGAKVRVWSERLADGYVLEAWFPAEALIGYDPAANPRLGWYLMIRDKELGEHPLTVDRNFPFDADPSLWQSLELYGAR